MDRKNSQKLAFPHRTSGCGEDSLRNDFLSFFFFFFSGIDRYELPLKIEKPLVCSDLVQIPFAKSKVI